MSYESTADCVSQRFCREVVGWMTLRHPNILPLLGVTMSGNRLVMVSEWMEKGNIKEFVSTNPNADRLGLVCLFFRIIVFVCHLR